MSRPPPPTCLRALINGTVQVVVAICFRVWGNEGTGEEPGSQYRARYLRRLVDVNHKSHHCNAIRTTTMITVVMSVRILIEDLVTADTIV